MSEKYPLQETLSPIDKKGRDRLNENWTRIMAYFDHVQLQIKALAGGHEVDELIARLEQAIANAETDLQNYIAQVDTTVQEAIDANNIATQDAINANNQALQTALNTIGDALTEVSGAIQVTETATNNAVEAKNAAIQATQDAQNAINSMQSLIDNFDPKGTWSSTTQYYKNNLAEVDGRTYIALKNNINTPVTDKSTWALFADKGATGGTGPQGLPGKDGKDGTGVTIIGSLPSEDDLPSTGNMGDAYLINGFLYVWNGTVWENVGEIQGPEGKSAYDLAVQNGFVGTMEEWLESLKGGIGPPGPEGPPGKDADLTEVNQEIANLQQTVSDNKTEVTEHLGHGVLSEDGVHGIRYFNDKLETKNGESWSEIEIGKANARGTQSLSPNHAIRRFTRFSAWANNTTAETLWLAFKDMPLSGQLILRGSIYNGSTSANAGGFEYSLQVFRGAGASTQMENTQEFIYLGTYVSDRFVLGSQVTNQVTKQPLIPITKRLYDIPIYLEIEYISGDTSAFEALDSIEFELQPPQPSPDTSPKQQSIFTHVGNSKQDLATAITGKGVATSADATFATMVANINAIPTGKKQASGTTTTGANTLSFQYYGGGGSYSLPYFYLYVPFKPSLVYAVYEASGISYVTTFTTNALEGKAGDFGSAKVTSMSSNSSSYGSYNMYLPAPSVSGNEFILAIPVPAGLNSKPFKWFAFE